MYKVKFYKEATIDYYEIGNYIASDNLFYAKEVLDKIDSSIDIISTFPSIGKEIKGGFRMIVEPRYRYKIVYRIESETIYVVSIFKYKNLWE